MGSADPGTLAPRRFTSNLADHPTPIATVLVEDDDRTRAHMASAVQAHPRLELLACFDRAQPALDWLRQNRCDVLLTDLGLPDGSGLEVIALCAELHPLADIMVVSMFGDEKNVLAAIEAGAAGYVLKDAADLDVAQAILTLRAGGSPMSPLIARKLLSRVRTPAPSVQSVAPAASRRDVPSLTRRESDTLEIIARGYTYEEAAQVMGVTVSTVQTHIKSMYRKLAVNSRSEAVFEARVLGLLGRRRSDAS